MFEKEAKERARTLEGCQTLGVYDDDESYARDLGWNEGEVAGYEEGFKDGAEFVYNEQLTKAKEILEDIIKFQPYIDRDAMFLTIGNDWKEVIFKAEQFLNSEVEK